MKAPHSLGELGRGTRVFIGLSEVAGLFSSLEAGFRDLGIEATFHNLSPNLLAYGGSPRRSYQRILRIRLAVPGSAGNRLWMLVVRLNRVVRRVRAAFLFPMAVARYDMFVLGGHETFLGGADLWILRRLRKRVVIIFTGSDHRPPYLNGNLIRQHGGDPRALAGATRRIRRRVARAERWATEIIALPTSAQLHRRSFIDLLQIGVPFAPPRLEPETTRAHDDASRELRALHCPTDPLAKGSAEIRRAVEACKSRGATIALREISGRPNIEVLEALQECDFVVDERYSDTPMARFATEAAYYGKPVIVGSYATTHYRDRSGKAIPPSFMCHPDEIEAAIMTISTDAALREELGLRAERFVKQHWRPTSVAQRLVTVLSGAAPAEWRVDPLRSDYIHGWGVSEAMLRATLHRMIRETGVDSLQLGEGTKLRELAIELGQGPPS